MLYILAVHEQERNENVAYIYIYIYSEICLQREYEPEKFPAPQLGTFTVVFTALLEHVLHASRSSCFFGKAVGKGNYKE